MARQQTKKRSHNVFVFPHRTIAASSLLGIGVVDAVGALARHHLRQGHADLRIANDASGPAIFKIAHDDGAIEKTII